MLINCGHPDNKIVTKEFVNDPTKTGAYLHRFSWLGDEKIGKLSHEWNWLVGWYSEPTDGKPLALHYTEGGPWFLEYEDCEYANEYYKVERRYLKQQLLLPKKNQDNFEHLTDSKKKLINSVLFHVLDPAGTYHGVNKTVLDTEILNNMSNKVAAIDSDGGIGYRNKNLSYDTHLQNFILGSGGYISSWEAEETTDSALVIRGLGGSSQKAIVYCKNYNRTFYAIDTGYFGNQRKKAWHRITKNSLQHLGPIIDRPNDRLKKIIDYRYQQQINGSKILICPPSEKVMNLFGQPDPETWTAEVVQQLKLLTDRPVEIRLKPTRGERVSTKTIEAALADDVYCLITYNSIAAVEALMNGKPAIALGPNAAQCICNISLNDIENLKFPTNDKMSAFMRHLSYAQFTVEEMQNGTAWRIVNESS